MKTTISLQCIDQTLQPLSLPKLTSGGRQEVRVEFTFDSMWDGYGKTAIFYRDKSQVLHVLLEDNACVVPWSVMGKPGKLYVGVYGANGETTRTSEVLALHVAQGAILGASDMDPTPDVYQQMLSEYDRLDKRVTNLSTLKEGSTTGDAELQDIRLGYDGTTYPNAGEAVRKSFTKLSGVTGALHTAFLAGMAIDEDCYIPFELQLGKCINEWSDVINVNSGNQNYHVSQNIPVTPGEVLLVSGYATDRKPVYSIYDAAGNALDALKADSARVYNNVAVYVPTGASYMIIAGHATIQPARAARDFSVAKPWAGKTWVAYGDSITEKNYRAQTNYVDYIVEEMGVTALNYGVSGSGYAQSEYAWHSRITELANIDFDVITLYGSGNDLAAGKELGDVNDTGTDTLCGCINTTLDTLLGIKPLAKVGIILSQPWASYMPSVEGNAMQVYNDKLSEIAKRRSIPVLDLYHASNLRPDNATQLAQFYQENGVQDSGVHPNSAGHKRIYPLIREFLRGLM